MYLIMIVKLKIVYRIESVLNQARFIKNNISMKQISKISCSAYWFCFTFVVSPDIKLPLWFYSTLNNFKKNCVLQTRQHLRRRKAWLSDVDTRFNSSMIVSSAGYKLRTQFLQRMNEKDTEQNNDTFRATFCCNDVKLHTHTSKLKTPEERWQYNWN